MQQVLFDRIFQPERAPRVAVLFEQTKITFEQLRALTIETGEKLNSLAIRPGDRVAILLNDSPEFIASYNAAAERKVAVRSDVLQSILRDFQVSDEFTSKAPRTRKDYAGIIAKIEKEFGDFPLAGINKEPDQARGAFLEWRDKLVSRIKNS